MSTFWKTLVRRIANGNPVDASVSNAPTDDLVDRTEWLKRRFESLQSTSGRLIMSGVPVEASVQTSSWVYLDGDSGIYRNGLAAMELTGSGMPRPARSAFVSGVVTAKTGPTTADVMIIGEAGIGDGGVVQIPSMSYMMEGDEVFAPGEYYLSASVPGRMTANPSGAPVVRLGSFTNEKMQVSIHTRLMQDGHVHHRFALRNYPSSQGGGWASITDGAGLHGFVNYSNDVAHKGLIDISVSVTPGMVWDGVRRRIRVRKADSGSALLIESNTLSWLGIETAESLIEVTKPPYGTLIDLVAGVVPRKIGVSVSFLRPGFFVSGAGTYTNGFTLNFSTEVPQSKGWVIDLPDALSGWTNCCPSLDDQIPVGASLRYITEGQYDLSSLLVVSPLPSPTLTIGGDLMVGNWVRTHSDIYWTEASADPADWKLPWSEDLDLLDPGTLLPAFIAFSSAPHGDSDPVVRSLFSSGGIARFVKVGTDESASTGALELILDYRLAVDLLNEAADNRCLASISADGKKILTGPRVSEIVPGPNILIRRVMPDGSLLESGVHSGKIRIDLASTSSEGASPSFSLFNAKESERNGVSFIEFLPPGQVATAAVARISVPNLEVGDGDNLRMEILTQWLGNKSGGVDPTLAVMKLEVRVVRPGVNLSGSISAPAEVHALGLTIGITYAAFKVMDEESVNTFNTAGLILPGDQIFVRISRDTNESQFNVGPSSALEANILDPDDYTGQVGLVSTKWRFYS